MNDHDYFREYVDGFGVIELTKVKRAGRRTAIFLHIHGDARRLDLATDASKRLDSVIFRCKQPQNSVLELHFVDNSNGFDLVDKYHPVMRQLIEAIEAKTTRKQATLVRTGRFTRPSDFD